MSILQITDLRTASLPMGKMLAMAAAPPAWIKSELRLGIEVLSALTRPGCEE